MKFSEFIISYSNIFLCHVRYNKRNCNFFHLCFVSNIFFPIPDSQKYGFYFTVGLSSICDLWCKVLAFIRPESDLCHRK